MTGTHQANYNNTTPSKESVLLIKLYHALLQKKRRTFMRKQNIILAILKIKELKKILDKKREVITNGI